MADSVAEARIEGKDYSYRESLVFIFRVARSVDTVGIFAKNERSASCS